MNITDKCGSDRHYGPRGLLGYFLAWAMAVLGLGIGVPIGLIVLAVGVCVALPDDWHFGTLPMLGLIIIDAFPCGWVLSGLGCWAFGSRWSRNHRTHILLGRPLEYWGLIIVGLGLLIVAMVSFGGVEIR